LIVGGDAQTLSWAQVFIDYPQLVVDKSLYRKPFSKAQGVEPLASDVFKVPHHCSKQGLNLELVEQISPSMSLISSVGGGGKYNFPHLVSLEGLREGVDATVKSGKAHKPDYDLDIHYTFGVDEADQLLGSMAARASVTSRRFTPRFMELAQNAQVRPGDSNSGETPTRPSTLLAGCS
jgi:hypothetical protein